RSDVPGLSPHGGDRRARAVRDRRGRRDPLELRLSGGGQSRCRRDPARARRSRHEGGVMSRTEWAAELTVPVSVERDHVQGPADAPATLVQYGDYECPYCGEAYPIVKEVQRKMGDRLLFVFRNFPISTSHPHAEQAAEAAEAAGGQGMFWEMHDTLYEHQQALDAGDLDEDAAGLGLDVAQFERELTTPSHAPRGADGFGGGIRSGVNGTPTFFINGQRHDGPYDQTTLLAMLEAALGSRGRR